MFLFIPFAILTGGLAFLAVFLLFVPVAPETITTAHDLKASRYSLLRMLGHVLELATQLDIFLSEVYLALFQFALKLVPLLFAVFVWKLIRS